MTNSNKVSNRLIHEKSPYLLQHAYNPVDWYPWCEEAFVKAKEEDKPVFLSIGYSTCHWCHVMERESFEDEEVAGLLNDAFVCIKVDREERPDIDNVYMSVCQMMTGSGGWPLTIIMTPDKKPFFAGTYIPKESMYGRVGIKELTIEIKKLWKSNREDVLKSAEEIIKGLHGNLPLEKAGEIKGNVFKDAYSIFSHIYDNELGGFGNRPKFPTPHNLMFLLRYWRREKEPHALEMVEKTLIEMKKGGIFDHIGFGFHRYSTDRRWLVPHFEKMLYDQAMLAMAYTEAYQATYKEFYKETACEIFEYVLRDIKDDNGGFYSAEDADSEGVEGKFYVWSKKEIEKYLTEDEFELAIKAFDISEEGNFIDEVQGEKTGANIIHISRNFNLQDEDIKSKLDLIRQKLFIEREKRIRPFRDEKILTDWNSLMISALSRGSRIFNNDEYYKAAKEAADFIINGCSDGKLCHSYFKGEWMNYSNIDDYSFFIGALIDLYEAKFETYYLKQAVKFAEDMIKYFADEKSGGFYIIPSYVEMVLVRNKETYDGAIPSGNSAAYLNLLRLGRLTGRSEFEREALKVESIYADALANNPASFSYFLCGYDFAAGPSSEIVIVGKQKSADTIKILDTLDSVFNPNKVVIFKNEENPGDIIEVCNFINDNNSIDGKATVYICKNFACMKPTTNPEDLLKNIT